MHTSIATIYSFGHGLHDIRNKKSYVVEGLTQGFVCHLGIF
jgi:hypothetical protein